MNQYTTIPTAYTYKHFYFLHVSLDDKLPRKKGFKTGAQAAQDNYQYIIELLRSELLQHNIELLAVCLELKEEEVSHPHFHFLLNTNIYSFKEISSIMFCSLAHIKSRLINKGIIENTCKFYIKFKGEGYPYNPQAGSDSASPSCPPVISRTCPFKSECPNKVKKGACPNYIVYISQYDHLLNVYEYIRRDKTTGGSKKLFTYYDSYIENFILSSKI